MPIIFVWNAWRPASASVFDYILLWKHPTNTLSLARNSVDFDAVAKHAKSLALIKFSMRWLWIYSVFYATLNAFRIFDHRRLKKMLVDDTIWWCYSATISLYPHLIFSFRSPLKIHTFYTAQRFQCAAVNSFFRCLLFSQRKKLLSHTKHEPQITANCSQTAPFNQAPNSAQRIPFDCTTKKI